jgi:ubiquinone/menaquinone biosynthesis C-methylase UbiE
VAALRGLSRLNAVSRAHDAIWRQVRPVLLTGDSCTLLDVACASGDLAIDLAFRARKLGKQLRIMGCDINRASLAMARERAQAAGLVDAEFIEIDAIAGQSLPTADLVTTSLFLHHLPTENIAPLLASFRRAAKARIIVNDLMRSRLNLTMVTLASRLLSRSPIVHVDARLSVKAAFTQRELLDLAAQAGWSHPRICFGGFGRVNLICDIKPAVRG